jgi:hypothetical protein
MKKRVLMAATAALLANSILTMPALAAIPPMLDVTDMSPQEVCDEQLRPNNPNSKFLTAPENVVVGAWVNDGAAYPDLTNPVGDPEGYGTPTHSNVVLTNGFYRNGGSPNIWGGATATATYPQTRQQYEFEQDQTRTTSFDCKVWKNPGGPAHGPDEITPDGLQSSGNTIVESRTISAGVQWVITEDDFIVEGETVYALACISPNNTTKGKPGSWVGKHGMTAAQCAAIDFTKLNNVPSNNSPDSY